MSLVGMGFDSKHDFAPPTVLLGLLLCPLDVGYFCCCCCWIQHHLVDGCSAASCNFGVLAGEDECTSFYSAILVWSVTCRGMGQQWPAAGAGALNAADLGMA